MYKRETKPTIIVISKPIDFRCGAVTLVRVLKEEYKLDPFQDSLYVFTNKTKRSLKLLYWGGAGFWLISYKPLEGKFKWFKTVDVETITYEQMEWLLNGLEVKPKNLIKEIKSRVF